MADMKDDVRFPWEFDGETISIETPEQTKVEYLVASFGSRLVAALLDKLIILGVVVGAWTLILLAGFLAGAVGNLDLVYYIAAFFLALQFLFTLFYYVWWEVRNDGQTWGKRRLNLRVIQLGGQGVTLGASVVRNLARVIDEFPLLWIVPALVRGQRRMGDLMAGTLVILTEHPAITRGEQSEGDWLASSNPELEDRQYYFSPETADRVFPDDLNLLEHLEARLKTARRSQRKAVLEDVARRYVARLQMEEDEERIAEDPRRFLGELILYLRQRFDQQDY